MVRLGVDAFWTIPLFFVVTISYHTAVLVVEYNEPQQGPLARYSTASTIPAIFGAGVLVVAWIGGLALTVLAIARLMQKEGGDKPGNMWTLFAVAVVILLELVVLVSIVVRSLLERTNGRTGGSWRKPQIAQEQV